MEKIKVSDRDNYRYRLKVLGQKTSGRDNAKGTGAD